LRAVVQILTAMIIMGSGLKRGFVPIGNRRMSFVFVGRHPNEELMKEITWTTSKRACNSYVH
jgi:hypothetical protein